MLTISRKSLKDAVTLCSAALSRGPMVFSSSLLLRYSCAELTVTGRSIGSAGCEATTRVKADGPDDSAAILVDAKRLAAAVKGGSDQIELQISGNQLLVRNVADTTLQSTMPVAEFPALLNDDAPGDSMLVPEFGANFAWVALAACRDTTRRHIAGVYSTGTGVLVTTDGHRMHVAPLPEGTPSFFVPLNAVKAVLRLRGDIAVRAIPAGFSLSGDNGSVTFGPYDHTFPPHSAVIPGRYESRVDIGLDEADVSRWLATLAALGEESLRFKVNGTIAVTGGAVEAPTSAELPGERRWRQLETVDVDFGICPAYLADALTGLACEVILQSNSPTANPPQHLDPIRIDYASGCLAVIMPVRVA